MKRRIEIINIPFSEDQRIPNIKSLRYATDLSLKESKDIIDEFNNYGKAILEIDEFLYETIKYKLISEGFKIRYGTSVEDNLYLSEFHIVKDNLESLSKLAISLNYFDLVIDLMNIGEKFKKYMRKKAPSDLNVEEFIIHEK